MSVRGACVTLLVLAVAACAAPPSPDAVAGPSGTVSYFIEGPGDILAVTHGKQVSIAAYPPGIPDLAGTPVGDTLLLLALLRDAGGAVVGIASELEHFPTLPVEPGTRWNTYWTLVVPGRGTLYACQQEALSAALVAAFGEAAGRGDWHGLIRKQNTVGPGADRLGRIVGGTGAYAGAGGTFAEVGELRAIRTDGTLEATLELRFDFSADQAAFSVTPPSTTRCAPMM